MTRLTRFLSRSICLLRRASSRLPQVDHAWRCGSRLTRPMWRSYWPPARQSRLTAFRRGIGVTPVEPPLLGAITRLIGLLDIPHDIGALSPLVLREIAYRVLTGPQGARLRQIVAPGAPAQRIARAVAWLKDHFTEPARIEALAKHVGLSSSALHLHFKAVTGLSPLQYQKRFRLKEARRLMLSDGLDAAEAAFRVGYESPSQFGREYRRLFGAPPRQDVASLTATAQPTGYSGI